MKCDVAADYVGLNEQQHTIKQINIDVFGVSNACATMLLRSQHKFACNQKEEEEIRELYYYYECILPKLLLLLLSFLHDSHAIVLLFILAHREPGP